MIRVEELGISQSPWRAVETVSPISVVASDDNFVCDVNFVHERQNASLIAAATRMYEEIYDDAVCLKCIVKKLEEGCDVINLKDTLKSMSDRMERVLAKASGEEAK